MSKVELLIKSPRDWTNCAYILKFGRIIIIVQDNDSDWHLDDIVVLRVPRRVHSVLNGHQELKRVLALQLLEEEEEELEKVHQQLYFHWDWPVL